MGTVVDLSPYYCNKGSNLTDFSFQTAVQKFCSCSDRNVTLNFVFSANTSDKVQLHNDSQKLRSCQTSLMVKIYFQIKYINKLFQLYCCVAYVMTAFFLRNM